MVYRYLYFWTKENDSTILKRALNAIYLNIEVNKYKNSKKFKKFLADKGYDSAYNRKILEEKGYKVIIDHNKRNCQNPILLKEKQLTLTEKKHYFFAHINVIFPQTQMIYDKNLNNYLNSIYLIAIIKYINMTAL